MVRQGEHLTEEYRKVHPLQRVPALRLENGEVLTEVSAILSFVAELKPELQLLPQSGLERARAVEWMSLFASGVHPAFWGFIRPGLFTDDDAAQSAIKREGLPRFLQMLKHVEARLPGGDHILPSGPSLVDAYASVFFLWALRTELPTADLPKYTRLAQAVAQRPAVRRAFEAEGLSEYLAKLERPATLVA
jgi:glutathione S-transferase